MVRYRRWVAAGAAVATTLVLAATAYAGTSGGDDEYAGCVEASSGVLRMLSPGPGGECRQAETPILWRGAGDGSPTPGARGGNGGDTQGGGTAPAAGPVSSSGGGTVVNLRSVSAPIDGQTVVQARCEEGEVPVNGYSEVDGEDPFGNPKVFLSLGDTRETRDGFQASIGPNPFYVGEPASEVTAFARCLVVS